MNPLKWQDEARLERLKKGDQELRRQLYDEYAPALYSAICRLVPQTHDREQLMMEVFATIFAQLPSFHPDHQRLFSWMHSILHLRLVDWHERSAESGS